MQFNSAPLLALFGFLSLSFSAPVPQPSASPGDALVQTLDQFSNGTWVENIAVRSNGNLLVSHIDKPEIWQIDPSTQSTKLVYHFPNASAAAGIAEIEKDTFVVAVGNFSYQQAVATQGSWSAWEVKFGGWHGNHFGHHSNETVEVRKITNMPEAFFLNGATSLNTSPGVALIGDAGQGVIYRLDAANGKYNVIADDLAFKPNASVPLQLGINGIRYREGYVYFVNTFKTPLYGRIPVDADGEQTGPVEVIAQEAEYALYEGAAADDFALDRYGNAWLAAADNTLVKISPHGEQTIIAGGVNSTVVKGCTSAAFGRTWRTRDTLYITTNGGLLDPSLGVEGGEVLTLDVAGL